MRFSGRLLICFLILCAASAVGQDLPIFKDLNSGEALALIQENKDNPRFLILDIRTPEEYAEERLAGAVNLDFYAETFRDSLSKLDMAGRYLVYCRSGARTRKAMEIMEELGFQEVYILAGGLNSWLAAGMPVTRD